MPRLARVGLTVVGGLILTFVAAFAVLSLVYSPTYIIRLMMWQEADVQDHTRFPAREVDVAPESFSFESPPDPVRAAEAVRVAMEATGSVGDDMEASLEEMGTQAFIVIQDDVVLYERYFGDFDGEAIGTSFSVAKSYVSALVGIAIEEGAIHSVDDPITDYLPELRDQRSRHRLRQTRAAVPRGGLVERGAGRPSRLGRGFDPPVRRPARGLLPGHDGAAVRVDLARHVLVAHQASRRRVRLQRGR
jgi:hypothetical protein